VRTIRPCRRCVGVGTDLFEGITAKGDEVHTELDEQQSTEAVAFVNDAEEQVLGADMVVVELERFPVGEFQNDLRPGSERRRAGGRRIPVASTSRRVASSVTSNSARTWAATPSRS